MLGVDFRQVCSPALLLKKLAKSFLLADGCCQKQNLDDNEENPEAASSSRAADGDRAPGAVEVDEKATSQDRRASVPSIPQCASSGAPPIGSHNRSASWPSASFQPSWDDGGRYWRTYEGVDDDEGPRLHSLDCQSGPFEWGVVGEQRGSVMSFLRDSRIDREWDDDHTTMARARSCPSLSRRSSYEDSHEEE